MPGQCEPCKPGTLYVVATPIGNLEDITLRALRILREADLILAEDTRVTRKLLSRYDIHTPLASYHAHSESQRTDEYVHRLIEGGSLALVTDAGTPTVSDPGDRLVAAAAQAGVPVTPIPGPSALTAVLSVSGVPGGRFVFEGFPPRGRSDRREFFEGLRDEPRAIVLYEAPQRLVSTLRAAFAALGNREAVIGRELTKTFEEIIRGTLEAAIERFSATPPRGELTIVIHPAPPVVASGGPADDEVRSAVAEALGRGLTRSDAARYVATALGIPRRDAYRAVLEHVDHG